MTVCSNGINARIEERLGRAETSEKDEGHPFWMRRAFPISDPKHQAPPAVVNMIFLRFLLLPWINPCEEFCGEVATQDTYSRPKGTRVENGAA